MTFARRLSTVLAGRSLAPWTLRLGLGREALAHMRAGRLPGRNALERICRAEGVRARWLIDGQGPPYTVAAAGADDAMAVTVETMLTGDRRWRRYLVTDGTVGIIVLTQAAELTPPVCAYTVVAILSGEVGPRTLRALGPATRYHRIAVDWRTLESIRGARVGPYALVGEDGHSGLLGTSVETAHEA